MSWARLDDSFHSHEKTVLAWAKDPTAIALWARAVSWVANHEKDGRIPSEVLEMWMPDESRRLGALTVLLDVGFIHEDEGSYVVHDYLDYNMSRAELATKRERERERKAKARNG